MDGPFFIFKIIKPSSCSFEVHIITYKKKVHRCTIFSPKGRKKSLLWVNLQHYIFLVCSNVLGVVHKEVGGIAFEGRL